MNRTLTITAALSLAAIVAMAASDADARCVAAGAITECTLAKTAEPGQARLLKRFGTDPQVPTFRVVVEWQEADPGCTPESPPGHCLPNDHCSVSVMIDEGVHGNQWRHWIGMLLPDNQAMGGFSSMIIARDQETIIIDEFALRFTPSSCWAGITMRYAEHVDLFFR